MVYWSSGLCSVAIAAFDVHLDEIHARQLQLRHQIQREGVVFIPYAFRVHDHASAGRLRGQIAPDAFHAGGRDFDRNHRLRPGLQRLAREIAVARAAIQHHVAGVNEMLARAIDVLLHLRQVGRQHVTVAFGDPKLALGRAPQLQTAVFLHQVAARQDAVLYALLVHIGLALDGVRHRANRAVAGDHQRPWPDWGKDEVGRHSGGDQNDEGKNDAGSLHIVINNPMSAPANVKVVLVTGASSGIGQAIARHLAARGWRVFGTSHRETTGFDGVDMLPMEVDDDDSVTRAVSAIAEKTGRLDAVVNNAGWALMGPVEDTPIAEARAQMETNFFGVLRVCRAALPVMREQRSGHIVNISSLGGIFGIPFSGIYSAEYERENMGKLAEMEREECRGQAAPKLDRTEERR